MGKKRQEQKRDQNPVIRAEAALAAAEKALATADTRTVAALSNFHQVLNLAIDGIDPRRHQVLVSRAKKVKLALKDIIEERKQAPLDAGLAVATSDDSDSLSQLRAAA